MNKRMVTLCVGFALIAIVLILNGTVFSVDQISVEFDQPQTEEEQIRLSEEVVKASGLEKGKNVFIVSESTMVRNIQSAVPSVRVLGIERVFPNKIVIYASKRIAVLAIPFKQGQQNTNSYAIVDCDMVVLAIKDKLLEGIASVSGFELVGNLNIQPGNVLDVAFGEEIFYLQNISMSFRYAGLSSDEIVAFVSDVSFSDNILHIKARSGVDIILGSVRDLTTEVIKQRISKVYEWYKGYDETSPEILGGYVVYNPNLGDFVWNEA